MACAPGRRKPVCNRLLGLGTLVARLVSGAGALFGAKEGFVWLRGEKAGSHEPFGVWGAILSAVSLTVVLLTLLHPIATTLESRFRGRTERPPVPGRERQRLGESVNTTRSSAPNALEVRTTKSTSACDGRSSRS